MVNGDKKSLNNQLINRIDFQSLEEVVADLEVKTINCDYIESLEKVAEATEGVCDTKGVDVRLVIKFKKI